MKKRRRAEGQANVKKAATTVGAQVYRNITRLKVGNILPDKFEVRLPGNIGEPITLVAFPERVVISRVVEKGLTKAQKRNLGILVFVARSFTLESIAMAKDHGGFVISNGPDVIQDTDESRVKLKVLTGCKVKKPDIQESLFAKQTG